MRSVSRGVFVDYYLKEASEKVSIEFLDPKGQVIRTFSGPSAAPSAEGRPPEMEEGEEGGRRGTPAPRVTATKGMNRFTWDMHYDPLPGGGGGGRGGGGGGNGAVPGRTYTSVNAPWVAPGTYSVRLTVDGHSMTQPITVKMDPRVTASRADLEAMFSLESRLAGALTDSAKADLEAHSAREQIGRR